MEAKRAKSPNEILQFIRILIGKRLRNTIASQPVKWRGRTLTCILASHEKTGGGKAEGRYRFRDMGGETNTTNGYLRLRGVSAPTDR